ncbi:MAG: toprim domain-containing protein [gamma proteobacterium endosymbiont of Lamellibrachia anaximandri]|nr:toprim domain-containing protein [gamma proteobacterium endosymbiont of Lamellibrachia anaximandri]MBL3618869.1 toprim domain-containing protein [gamma proteobacterium endosymbiont of Lamellibrachia anaximandri]
MFDSISQFRDAIQASGLMPPNVIEPGKLYRFPGIGKRHGNTAGWCKLFDDELGGCFGDWSSGFSENWHAKRVKPFTTHEREAFKHRVAEARAQAKGDREIQQIKAAKRASTIWSEATLAPDHYSYLVHKDIKANGAMLYRNALTLPVIDFTGKMTSLQFIKPDGQKLLLSGGRKRGCFIHVAGDMKEPDRVIICEGWATGCTLAEDNPSALVLAAIDVGNLKPVAVAARRRLPSAELVIAGDDDRLTAGNPGATKARAAAIASGALLALPQWPVDAPENLTDFNDLAAWLKRKAV